MKKLLSAFIGSSILAAGLAVAPAQAALLSAGLACTNGSALTAMNPDAMACSGAWDGNDANQQTDVLAQLNSDFASYVGAGTWSFTDKADAGENTSYFNNVPGTSTGTITFDNALKGYFAIALKSSTNFSFYLFNGGTTGISSIDYSNIGTSLNHNGQIQGLSHASLYTFSGGGTKVPEPATILGLSLVGGGLVLSRRRKKAN